jgi:N-acetylmuramoyl-L-alanine amidase CwlA
MSGEGLSVSFRRTSFTDKSNAELLEEFQKIIYNSRVMRHMKWYGKLNSVDILEHGDDNPTKISTRICCN